MSYVSTPPTFADGETVHAAKLNALADGIQVGWDLYTPTWKSLTGADPAIGNGAIHGSSRRIGHTVEFRARITMGSTTTYGAGKWLVGLPYVADGAVLDDLLSFKADLIDSSTSGLYVVSTLEANTQAVLVAIPGVPAVYVDATHPFTWAANDDLLIRGTYQGA